MRVCRFAFSLAIASGFFGVAHAENFGQVTGASVRLGAGFNPVAPEKVYPACIVADTECQTGSINSISCLAPKTGSGRAQTPTPLRFAPATAITIREIQNKYEYFRELNINASLSGSYGVFSGAASFAYHSIDDIDEDSISWAVTAKSEYGSFALSEPTISENYQIGKNSIGDVIETCGPQYISEVDRGVLVSVLYTFHTLSVEKLRQTSASLSAGFNAGFSANGSASFKDLVEEFSKIGKVSVRVFAIGGEGTTSLEKLINTDPTNLGEVKKIISEYVQHQDMARSSILSFRTTSMGKLLKRPEIDADYTSYLQFLDRINEYRLTLEDLTKRLDNILYNRADFGQPAGPAGPADELQDNLNCELQLINLTARSCRAWIDGLTRSLANGKSSDDLAAQNLLMNGVFSPGGAGGADSSTYGVSLFSGTAQPPAFCKGRLEQVAEVASRIGVALSRKSGMTDLLEPSDAQPCAFTVNSDLLADLRSLPRFPFTFKYYFDYFDSLAAPVFPGDAGDVMYVRFEKAEHVSFAQVKTSEGQLLKVEANADAQDTFSFSLPVPPDVRGKDVAILVVMESGSAYTISAEVPLPYVPAN